MGRRVHTAAAAAAASAAPPHRAAEVRHGRRPTVTAAGRLPTWCGGGGCCRRTTRPPRHSAVATTGLRPCRDPAATPPATIGAAAGRPLAVGIASAAAALRGSRRTILALTQDPRSPPLRRPRRTPPAAPAPVSTLGQGRPVLPSPELAAAAPFRGSHRPPPPPRCDGDGARHQRRHCLQQDGGGGWPNRLGVVYSEGTTHVLQVVGVLPTAIKSVPRCRRLACM